MSGKVKRRGDGVGRIVGVLVALLVALAAPSALSAGLRAYKASYAFASFGVARDRQDVVRPTAGGERRVYVPHNVPVGEAAIFWFGRVTLSENYTDVRLRSTDENLLLTLAVIDRRLWYNPSPSPDDLTSWDAVSLYVRPGGAAGETLDAGSYRFDVQLRWWEPNHADFRAAYRGDGGQWVLASVPFTATSGWNGDAPNNDKDDRGWMANFTIPFTSLGLEGSPAQGTAWGLGVAVHDRDSAAGPPLPAQVWPEAVNPVRPVTWGQLIFGLKPSYEPAPALPRATAVVRHGLDGAVVVDADVGGSSVCGSAAAPDYFPTWGELNYAGKTFLNVQRVDPISEWPCFSKYYVTFPLNAVPQGKVVLSATLTLYQFGSAGVGWEPPARPTFIQAFTVKEDWEESRLTWNNAPLAEDYVAATWVDPLDESPPWPGIPRHWDVSGVVAEAYAGGEPLRLALYSPDWAFHSGRYFYSSDIGGDGAGRPTLTVAWGDPVAQLEKEADKASANYGDDVKYALRFRGTGTTLILTDTLPSAVGWMGDVSVYGTGTTPLYDLNQHLLTWTDNPALGQQVVITYTVNVSISESEPLMNVAELLDQKEGYISTATSIVIANPYRIYLPLTMRAY